MALPQDRLDEELTQGNRTSVYRVADRDGFVPVHDRAVPQPRQLGDTVWYVAPRRNTRIFDDRTGITAAPSQCPANVQVCRELDGRGLWRVKWTP